MVRASEGRSQAKGMSGVIRKCDHLFQALPVCLLPSGARTGESR